MEDLEVLFFLLIKKLYFWLLWVFTAAHGLSLVAASRGRSLVAVCRLLLLWLLIVAASLVAERGL